MKRLWIGAALLYSIACAPAVLGAAEIVESPYGFHFEVPDGFERHPAAEQGNVIHYYSRRERAGQIPTVLVITRLHGVIHTERLSQADLAAAGSSATLLNERWHGLDVQGARVAEVVYGRPGIRLNIQLPIAGEAVQVGIAGDAVREDELHALLRTVLADLDGRSNLLNNAERADKLLYVLVGLGVAGFLFLVGKAREARSKRMATATPDRGGAFAGRGMLIGMALGAAVGGVWGYCGGSGADVAGAIGGAMLGGLAGMVVGMVVGVVAHLFTRRASPPAADRLTGDDALWAAATIFGRDPSR